MTASQWRSATAAGAARPPQPCAVPRRARARAARRACAESGSICRSSRCLSSMTRSPAPGTVVVITGSPLASASTIVNANASYCVGSTRRSPNACACPMSGVGPWYRTRPARPSSAMRAAILRRSGVGRPRGSRDGSSPSCATASSSTPRPLRCSSLATNSSTIASSAMPSSAGVSSRERASSFGVALLGVEAVVDHVDVGRGYAVETLEVRRGFVRHRDDRPRLVATEVVVARARAAPGDGGGGSGTRPARATPRIWIVCADSSQARCTLFTK